MPEVNASHSAPYRLSPDVYICVAGGQVVLLDLLSDRYGAVLPPGRLARWVQGWPVPEGTAESFDSPQDPVLTGLVKSGWLVSAGAPGKDAQPVRIVSAGALLVEPEFGTRPRVTAEQLWRLLRAWARAKWQLARVPVVRIASARAVARAQARATGELPSAVRDDVAAFLHLLPLLYTVRDGCLLDCLTLLHYLQPRGAFPEWVFGVQADPFLPHCWVQQGGCVFNDHPERLRSFSPIMVV